MFGVFTKLWLEKENLSLKYLKMFLVSTGSISGDSIKKEKILSSYSETAPLKTETHGPYCELVSAVTTTLTVDVLFDIVYIVGFLFLFTDGSGVVMKDKATYAGILSSCSLFLHIYTLYSWYSELKSLKNQKVIPK